MRVDLHPVYLISLEYHSLFNVDISNKGYYQIRLSSKPSNAFSSIDIRCLEKNNSESSILPFAVCNGIAISRTVELTFVEELLKIGDTFHIKVQLAPQNNFSKPVRLQFNIELWSMSCSRPPRLDLFEMDSCRSIEIELNPTRLTAVSRFISFDYKAPSILSLSVFVSLVSIMPRRRKSPPDPPISNRLREYYKNMTSILLKSMKSIEIFITHFSKHINTVVKFENTDISTEEAVLLANLESSGRSWVTLEVTAIELSNRLDIIFRQFLDIFSRSQDLLMELNHQYFEWRQRLLGEAFFFTERPIESLKYVLPYMIPDLISQLLKGKYINNLTQYPVSCPATDSPFELCSIIFEERYETGTNISQDTSSSDEQTTSRTDQVNLLKSSGSTKSLRLLKFRRKSVDSHANKRVSKPRLSVDLDVNNCLVSPKFDQGHGDQESSSNTQSENSETKACFATYNVLSTGDTDQIIKLVELVKERESIKQKLRSHFGYEGFLYSELACRSLRPSRFPFIDSNKKRLRYESPPHLIILVHGLEGSSDDLISYKNALRNASPDSYFQFLMSSSNQRQTWADFETLSSNLLGEVKDFVNDMSQPPGRISFIAHSMGGVIVRALLGLAESEWLYPKLHTFLSINSPHMGLAYAGRSINWGVQLVQWWKGSKSMEQLALRDAVSFNDSYIVRLSANKAFGRFKNILLIGCPYDLFVPHHSALIDQCKTSSKDVSALGSAYREMLENIHGDMLSSKITETVAKFSTFYNGVSNKTSKIAGRAAHLAAVEDDIFIEKLLSISALRYFV